MQIKENSLANLLKKEFPETAYLVPNVLPQQGITLLVGKPKIGMSCFALSLAVAVATGGNALGAFPVKPTPVLLCALQDTERRLQYRLNKLLAGEEIGNNFYYETRLPFLFNGGLDLLEQWFQKYQSTFVVVDVLQELLGQPLPGENVYDYRHRATSRLKELVDRYKASILVLHHTSKNSLSGFFDSSNDGVGLIDVVDTVLLLSRNRRTNGGLLSISGRDTEEKQIALSFNFPKWQVSIATQEV